MVFSIVLGTQSLVVCLFNILVCTRETTYLSIHILRKELSVQLLSISQLFQPIFYTIKIYAILSLKQTILTFVTKLNINLHQSNGHYFMFTCFLTCAYTPQDKL